MFVEKVLFGNGMFVLYVLSICIYGLALVLN